MKFPNYTAENNKRIKTIHFTMLNTHKSSQLHIFCVNMMTKKMYISHKNQTNPEAKLKHRYCIHDLIDFHNLICLSSYSFGFDINSKYVNTFITTANIDHLIFQLFIIAKTGNACQFLNYAILYCISQICLIQYWSWRWSY